MTDDVAVSERNTDNSSSGAVGSEPAESVPEQLVSEADVDNGDDDETAPAVSETPLEDVYVETALDQLTRLLREQGLTVSREGANLLVELPAGRSHRTIYVHEENAQQALQVDFASWRSLERFDGVWNQRTGTIEVALRGERFGMPPSRMLQLLSDADPRSRESADEAVEICDDASNVRLRLALASEAASVLLGSSRFRTIRPLALTIWPVRLPTTAAADALVETITDALSLQFGMRRGFLLAPRRLEDRAVARTQYRRAGGRLQFPSGRYPHAPVALYQAGRERTTSPLLRYWAFYQVLEYFFPKYSRADSLQRVSQLLRSPTFDAHDEEHVIRIVSTAESGGARLTEEEQLTLCLRAITTADEIRSFVADCGLEERLAAKKDALSSKTVNINGSDDIVGQLARRIYDIRCRIVHSKNNSQREQGPGLLPGTDDENLVRYELPLVDFLAEHALVASSDRLDMRSYEFSQDD